MTTEKRKPWAALILLPVIVALVWATAFMLSPGKGSVSHPALDAAVRQIVGKYYGELSPEELAQVTELTVRDAGIVSLEGIEKLTNLRKLDLRGNRISDIRPLAALTRLEVLNLRDNQISDISPLAGLKLLRDLNMRGNQVRDISPLKDLPLLRDRLYLRGNPIEDYSPILSYLHEITERDVDLSVPLFSHEGGFYEKAFELELSSLLPGTEIYYTLDGSVPSRNATRYTGPIRIANRENEPNRIANILTVAEDWHKPGKVFKGTVVRAIAYDANGNASDVVTKSYFVHPLGNKRYSLPIVSLSTDNENLFDHEKGIYVAGALYENISPNHWENPANYSQRGMEWERPAHIEFYETDGTLGFSEDVGIRIHGAASRANVLKSLRVQFRKEYGKGKLEYPLFPELPYDQFDSFVLRSAGNDYDGAYLRDPFMQSLLDETRLDTLAYRPAILFINGEYWGIHNIRERGDEDYFAEKYGISKSELDLLEKNADVISGTNDHYVALINKLRRSDVNDPAVYEAVKEAIDVDNFIDYQIAQIYFDNGDWPGNNIRFWRENKPYDPASVYGRDGRWRWLVFDTDFGFGMYGEHNFLNNTLQHATATNGPDWPNPEWSTFLLRTLFQNDEFRVRFVNRFADLMNTSFVPERVIEKLHAMKSVIEPEMREHIARWGRPYGMDHWYMHIERIETFAEKRPAAMRVYIDDYFKLGGISELKIGSVPQGQGVIKLNSLVLEPVQGWTGIYFHSVPVTLTAIPMHGYRFVGWKGDISSDDPTITIELTEDVTITPVFERQ
jgi:hypothetical protein